MTRPHPLLTRPIPPDSRLTIDELWLYFRWLRRTPTSRGWAWPRIETVSVRRDLL